MIPVSALPVCGTSDGGGCFGTLGVDLGLQAVRSLKRDNNAAIKLWNEWG
jgi:hypothetical protein